MMMERQNAWVCGQLWQVAMAGVGLDRQEMTKIHERGKNEMRNGQQLPRNACK
jgi:hypothetical protein